MFSVHYYTFRFIFYDFTFLYIIYLYMLNRIIIHLFYVIIHLDLLYFMIYCFVIFLFFLYFLLAFKEKWSVLFIFTFCHNWEHLFYASGQSSTFASLRLVVAGFVPSSSSLFLLFQLITAFVEKYFMLLIPLFRWCVNSFRMCILFMHTINVQGVLLQ